MELSERGSSGRAVSADHAALVHELTTVVDEVALRAGELVGLPRKHPDIEFLSGQVGTRQAELGLERINIVTEISRRVRPPRLEGLEALLRGVLYVSRTRCVVIGGH